ncbi:MAG: VanW family protein [Solirubrobacteraceae bacterium]|nr:VanW family protein [Solirubrobacteraceae bacterium]
MPTRARPRRPAWQRLLGAAGVIIVLVVGTTLAMRVLYSGQAMPGTQIGDENVSGKSKAELLRAAERLGASDRQLNLTGAGQTLHITAGGAGLRSEPAATVDDAMDAHRSGFFSPLGALFRTERVALRATVDGAELRDTVQQVAKAIDRGAYAGGLSIDNETLVATVVPSKAGRVVRQQQLADDLRERLLRPGSTVVRVPISNGTPVSSARLQELADEAERYLQAPLVLGGAGKDYSVQPAQLADLLAVEPLKGGSSARLGVNSAELSKLTARVADARDRAAKSASISAPPTGPTVDGKAEVSWRPKKAEVTVRSDGRSGLAVDVKSLNARVREAVRKNSHAAKVPTKVTPAPVSKSAAEKIDQVIGTFTTVHPPGQPRVTNIHRIADSVDGTVIAPGAEFSLNGVAGERTKAKGYVEAPFIAGNKIEPSVGGGVSQFSTTMYNAAYFAGLPIVASQPHSLYIDRYPAGRETTLNWPTIDLKWQNDTDAPILVRASYTDTSVTVTLYGHNGGRRVEAKPGERQPNPGGNFTITVTRVIRYPDGRVVEQPRTSSYANEVVDDEPQE